MENSQTIDSREKLISFLGETLEEANDEMCPFVDLTSQTIEMHIDSGFSGIEEYEEFGGHEIVDIDCVSSREAFSVMERFALSRQEKERNTLLHVLSKRHPFRAFRSEVEYLGILQEWYDFKTKAYAEFAEERLNDYDIDFVDGKIVCANPENIRTVEADNDDIDLDDNDDINLGDE